MEELTIIEVTRDGIIAVSRDGQRFSIALDDAIRSRLARAAPPAHPGAASPKEIQALLRSGLSVNDVAVHTGTSAEHVSRFEAPIVAELAFVLERALAVPVVSDDADSTFGVEIAARITEQGGSIVRWQAYRIDDEWVIGARCLIGEVEDDATWSFDPRKMTLVPSNAAAVRISKSESLDAALFPPLRVVAPQKPAARFDSGEFEPIPVELRLPEPADETPTALPTSVSSATHSIEIDVAAALPPETESVVDIVDELTRRRGKRDDAIASHPSTGSIPIITPDMLEAPEDSPVAPEEVPSTQVDPTSEIPAVPSEPFVEPTPTRSKRQRTAMPTWDEIVFGTRPDDK